MIWVLPSLTDSAISAPLFQLYLGLVTWWNELQRESCCHFLTIFLVWKKKKINQLSSHSKQTSVVKAFNNTRLVVKSETPAFRSFCGNKHNYVPECFLSHFQGSDHPARAHWEQGQAGTSPWWAGTGDLCVQTHGEVALLPQYYSTHLRWGNFPFHGVKQILKPFWLVGQQNAVRVDPEKCHSGDGLYEALGCRYLFSHLNHQEPVNRDGDKQIPAWSPNIDQWQTQRKKWQLLMASQIQRPRDRAVSLLPVWVNAVFYLIIVFKKLPQYLLLG